jgi:hypothetical protein
LKLTAKFSLLLSGLSLVRICAALGVFVLMEGRHLR